jgi:hypothetical protein
MASMEGMTVLEQISNLFYDPEVFWGVPLVFALLYEGYRRLKCGRRRQF